MQSRITLQLDLWETIREMKTFGTNRKIQAALWQRERALTVHSLRKKTSKNSKNKRHFIILCCILYTYKHSLAKKLFSDRFTQTTKILSRILARDPHLNSAVTEQSHATKATYPIASDRFTASEILSFLLNVHGIRLSLR